ncbi:hypothetical protein BUALT_Bualt02G0006000 [Buddleja alternifolia]|uniref:Uncharacterized protein n=1 Tax=Buddleja alternifolia TaxID=168488 RepID=A0AAV6Y0L8_9LAMI|nr:hypothetical protein BUALT_Bualt02G0006000 [Buddleja alternifolia]
MISYVNVHAVLDARKNRAKASPSDSDMSQNSLVVTLFRDQGLLLWALQTLGRVPYQGCFLVGQLNRDEGWKPTFVDLDISQGSITIPGCIAATPIELPIDPVEGVPLDMPLVYFHGHTTPSAIVDLYKALAKELAQVLEKQFAGNVEFRAAGMLLLHAIDTLNATVVLVLGQKRFRPYGPCLAFQSLVRIINLYFASCTLEQEKLWSMLKDVLKNKPNVDVVKLQKSGGVVSRNAKIRQKARAFRIREYFYGIANDLSPHSNTASFSDLCIYRVGGGPQAPRSALPVGAEPSADPTRLIPVSVNQELLHLVLAVSFAKEQDEIISSKKITYLASSAGNLPGKYLIMGSLTWYEP